MRKINLIFHCCAGHDRQTVYMFNNLLIWLAWIRVEGLIRAGLACKGNRALWWLFAPLFIIDRRIFECYQWPTNLFVPWFSCHFIIKAFLWWEVKVSCCLVVAQMSGDVLQTIKFVITFYSFSVANNLHFILPCKSHIDSYKSVTCCCLYLSIIAQLPCSLFIQEKKSFGCHLVSLVAYKLHIIRTSSLVTTSVSIATANKWEYIHVFIEAHHYSW